MTRPKEWSEHDKVRLRQVFDQQITGYVSNKKLGRNTVPHEHFRTLEGQFCTWQIREFEKHGMVRVNRASPRRYEISITPEGAAVLAKYNAKPSIIGS